MMTEKTETNENDTLLEIDNLSVSFNTVDGIVQALSNVSLEIREGEILGIIGESGSGKSTLASSLMSLLPDNANVTGTVKFKGDVITGSEQSGRAYYKIPRKKRLILDERLATMRWKEISMVFQGAMNSLNPVYTVRKQIREVFDLHTDLPIEEIDRRIEETSKVAGFNTKFLDSFPHQLSGGMKQRAVITMALALDPAIIIADEPTTGLDVITQAKIVKELKAFRETGRIKSMIIISHDVGVVSQLADRVAVLYAGRIMEIGKPSDIYLNQSNPYSKALIESYPSIRSTRKRVDGIPGSVPDLLHLPEGCFFASRCTFVEDKCRIETPPVIDLGEGHLSMCHFAAEFRDMEKKRSATVEESKVSGVPKAGKPLLEAHELTKYFTHTTSQLAGLFSRSGNKIVHAVDHVELQIAKGEILGVVGESGSGKTTLGRTFLMSYRPTSGDVAFDLHDEEPIIVSDLKEKSEDFRKFRRNVQLIFQDPYDSLNPKMSIFDIVAEPVHANRKNIENDGVKAEGNSSNYRINYDDIMKMVSQALETANLKPASNYLNRFPHELSGGERQRVSIARSLVLRPNFLVADEPISMLDVSIRANIMNLLTNLRDNFGMSILYISHDIASARYVSDKLAVMYLGKIVEFGPSEKLISNPLHPYTKSLINAVPVPDPKWISVDLKIRGEIGNSIDVGEGCRFYDRCYFRKEICQTTPPEKREVDESTYYCHFSQDELVEEKEEIIEESIMDDGETS